MIQLEDSIRGIKALHIPRIEDLPYYSSPPVQFVYESTAALALGVYTWADVPSALTVSRPVRENTIYFIRSISLTADITEFDFMSNISAVPQFKLYQRGMGNSQIFREPVRMNKFYDQFEFRLAAISHTEDDTFLGSFTGSITQGATLIGKASITLKAVISAQEIGDDAFVERFTKKSYPGE